jgi:hypothetical protein
VHCFAGCSFREIASALRAVGLWPHSTRRAIRAYQRHKAACASKDAKRWAKTVLLHAASDADASKLIQPNDVETVRRACQVLGVKWPGLREEARDG